MVNEYLSEVFPEGGEQDASPLLPKSPAGRAMARIITSRSNDLVTAYFTYLTNKNEVSSDVPMQTYVPDVTPLETGLRRHHSGIPYDEALFFLREANTLVTSNRVPAPFRCSVGFESSISHAWYSVVILCFFFRGHTVHPT